MEWILGLQVFAGASGFILLLVGVFWASDKIDDMFQSQYPAFIFFLLAVVALPFSVGVAFLMSIN